METLLVGKFQIENAMAAIALLAAQGHDGSDIAAALADFPAVCGRMERFSMPNGGSVIVDYAHNPDGLKHLLENGRLLCQGKLHVVFGCGGDRDKGKRPIMGDLAARLADVAWITSDNPRTEDPGLIIEDIMAGAGQGSASIRIEPDRAGAITAACGCLGGEDVLLVAGKGHEDYQLIGHTKLPFSDQAVIRGLGGT
jgi:UDP-N-acetylmuramoyl-L-alanyl-D-glutamate--2,6-diaminopimelate ligase